MKKTLAAALLACSLLAAAHGAPTAGIAHDIAHAGELRLQSQRLAKLWLQAGLGIDAGAAGRRLADGVFRFERSLAALAPRSRSDDVQRPLQRVEALWQEYRGALLLPYASDHLATVNRLADDLMLACGRLSVRLEGETEGGGGRLLDLSLRQNMLAQRLARLYLQAQAGDRSRSRLVDIEQARREFAGALAELVTARENTPASREALELARLQWLFFERALGEIGTSDSRPEHVATTSERIREVLDEVSRQYAADLEAARPAATGAARRRD